MQIWYFDPVIFKIGPLALHWYGLMYAIAFAIGYIYFHYSKLGKKLNLTMDQKDGFLAAVILGVLLGGRIGYILFYNLHYYLVNPLKILAIWEGGMSFHGGLIGVGLAVAWFARKYKAVLLDLTDLVCVAAPLGIMLGRIGNFINSELYGRVATKFCIYFPADPLNCRYPSQLLESFLEGFVLFWILFFVNRKTINSGRSGYVSGFFLFFYGVFRIFAEFFREPDAQIGFLPGGITEGQLLSIALLLAGAALIWKLWRAGRLRSVGGGEIDKSV